MSVLLSAEASSKPVAVPALLALCHRALVVLALCALAGAAPSAGFETQLIDLGRGNLLLFIPEDYTPSRAWPLLFNLHGYGSNGDEAEGYLGFQRFVDELGFLLIVPTGTTNPDGNTYWDATDACCDFWDQRPGDAEYLKSIYDEIGRSWNLSHAVIFGHSNGGYMANRMACEHGDWVRAIAGLAGAMFLRPQDCRATHPVRSLQVHGDLDAVVLFDGGDLLGVPYPGAFDSVKIRMLLHGCTGAAERGDRLDLSTMVGGKDTRTFAFLEDCPPGGEGELWEIQGEDHVPTFQLDFARRVAAWLLAGPSDVDPLGPPAVPTSLRVLSTDTFQVTLAWGDESSNELGFVVEQTGGGGPWTEVATAAVDATETTVAGLQAATSYRFRIRSRNGLGLSAPSDAVDATTGVLDRTCTASETIACLGGGRFRVEVSYRTPQGDAGTGRVVPLTADTVYVWFFDAANVEVVLKVLDACAFAGSHWVFAGGLTDVGVDVVVTDTRTGAVNRYQNELGTPFQPIQDTAAFDVCLP